VLCDASSEEALIAQIACALSAGSRAVLDGPAADETIYAFSGLPLERATSGARVQAALTDRRDDALITLARELAAREGEIVSLYRVDADTLRRDEVPLDLLLSERSLCVNTTAAGGNASLMSIG